MSQHDADEAAPEPTPAAARTRRWRERRREKRIVVPVVLGPREVGLLMAHRLLRIADRNDRTLIGEAVTRLLRGER